LLEIPTGKSRSFRDLKMKKNIPKARRGKVRVFDVPGHKNFPKILDGENHAFLNIKTEKLWQKAR